MSFEETAEKHEQMTPYEYAVDETISQIEKAQETLFAGCLRILGDAERFKPDSYVAVARQGVFVANLYQGFQHSLGNIMHTPENISVRKNLHVSISKIHISNPEDVKDILGINEGKRVLLLDDCRANGSTWSLVQFTHKRLGGDIRNIKLSTLLPERTTAP